GRADGGHHVPLAGGPNREAHDARARRRGARPLPRAHEEADRAIGGGGGAQQPRPQREAARGRAARACVRGMPMDAFEYQIKKDIRNNPIVREVDQARMREMWRSARVICLFAALAIYSAWQHFELIHYGYRLEEL